MQLGKLPSYQWNTQLHQKHVLVWKPLLPPRPNSYITVTSLPQRLHQNLYPEKHTMVLMQWKESCLTWPTPRAPQFCLNSEKLWGHTLHKCPTSYCLPEQSIPAEKLNSLSKNTSCEPNKQWLSLRIVNNLMAASVKGWVTCFKFLLIHPMQVMVDASKQQKKNTNDDSENYLIFKHATVNTASSYWGSHVQTSETEWHYMLKYYTDQSLTKAVCF